jgi:hypothetical protein
VQEAPQPQQPQPQQLATSHDGGAAGAAGATARRSFGNVGEGPSPTASQRTLVSFGGPAATVAAAAAPQYQMGAPLPPAPPLLGLSSLQISPWPQAPLPPLLPQLSPSSVATGAAAAAAASAASVPGVGDFDALRSSIAELALEPPRSSSISSSSSSRHRSTSGGSIRALELLAVGEEDPTA